jgi:DNA-binding transcriptional LysR family regulator
MERCEEAIEQLVQAEAELTRRNELSGTIRMTVPVDLPKQPLAELLGSFVDRHPAIRVEVIVTDDTLDLIANNLDLALRGGAPGAGSLVARKLGEGQLGFYASPEYVATRVPGGTLANPSEHVIYDPARRLAKSPGVKRQVAQIGTRNFELAKSLAMQSRGIALLPEKVCAQELATGSLLQLAHDEQIAPLSLYLVMPSRAHMPVRVRALVDCLTAPEKRETIL